MKKTTQLPTKLINPVVTEIDLLMRREDFVITTMVEAATSGRNKINQSSAVIIVS
jgi:hypothetical protein